MGKVPLACLAGGKVIVFGHHHKVLDGIQQKLGKAYQTMRIDSNINLSHIQTATCMHCRRQGDCVWTSPQGAGWHSAEAGQSISGHAH